MTTRARSTIGIAALTALLAAGALAGLDEGPNGVWRAPGYGTADLADGPNGVWPTPAHPTTGSVILADGPLGVWIPPP